ncbi:MAG: FtsQ-type POTRA domain-containing protein [Candidatus Eremiobacteraeota bacterium]|nr:FtsQ-type POTRA domain-containing protein [Candidatus Eremiobacteraeota bacterium]
MAEKPARRQQKSAGAKLRPFWILIALLVIAVAVGAYYAATWPGFYPKRVSVVGNRAVASSEILARAAIVRTQNLWLQSAIRAERRIETIPDVRTASVRRTLPANVTIDVTERIPYARVRTPSGTAVVDSALRVLDGTLPPASAPLPVFVTSNAENLEPGHFLAGERLRQLRADYERLRKAALPVRQMSLDKFGGLVATLPGNVAILFGEDSDLEKKASLVDPILSQLGQHHRAISALDLRAPSTPVVVYKK